MEKFIINRNTAQLAVLQRTELISPLLRNLRKILGRYIFSQFLSKYLINTSEISNKYFLLMESEYLNIKKYLTKNQTILSIGSGIGGLELLIAKNLKSHISLIEKNYISKKIRYGWDIKNNEGYNKLKLQYNFFKSNGVSEEFFKAYDFDTDNFPEKKFDIIISLYSLDYHYNFDIYKDYLKKILQPNTIMIFDTIRSEYFKKLFKNIDIIKEENNTVHKSKRIACWDLI
tara:strand:- start:249 stop:938 length:690 start_codon:yes stop_codon:yes gene_type:complete